MCFGLGFYVGVIKIYVWLVKDLFTIGFGVYLGLVQDLSRVGLEPIEGWFNRWLGLA